MKKFLLKNTKPAFALFGAIGCGLAVSCLLLSLKNRKSGKTPPRSLPDVEYRPAMILENERKHKRNFFSDPTVLCHQEELNNRPDILSRLPHLKNAIEASSQSVLSPKVFQEYADLVKSFISSFFLQKWREGVLQRAPLLQSGNMKDYIGLMRKQLSELDTQSKNRQKLIDHKLEIQDVVLNEAGIFWQFFGGNPWLLSFTETVGRIEAYTEFISDVLPMTNENIDLVIQGIKETEKQINKFISLGEQLVLLLAPAEISCHKLGMNLESFFKGIGENPERRNQFYTALGSIETSLVTARRAE